METGIELISKERQEQIKKHGYTLQHDDDMHENNELIDASLFLLMLYSDYESDGYFHSGWDDERKEKFMDKTQIQKLTVAGALIAAEIDRLQK